MKQIQIDVIPPLTWDPADFDPADPTAHIAAGTHAYHQMIYDLAQAGFKLWQYEDGDEEKTPIPGFPGRLLATQQRQALAIELFKAGVVPQFNLQLWNAQSELIRAQSGFCYDVERYFNIKYEKLPKQSNILVAGVETLYNELPDSALEWIKSKFKYLIGALLVKFPSILVFLEAYGWYIAVAIYVAWTAWEFLSKYYTKGASICAMIKSENTTLLALQSSSANIALRSKIYTQHDISLNNLLTMVTGFEQQVTENGKELDKLTEIWDEWTQTNVDQMDQIVGILQEISENIANGNKVNLDEIIEKLDGIVKVLETSLTFQEGGQEKSIFLRAMLTSPEGKSLIKEIAEKIGDLAFNGQRLHLPNGDVVELTGIGTVSATYNS